MLVTVCTVAQHEYEDAGKLYDKAGFHFEKDLPTALDDSIALSLYLRIAALLPESSSNAGMLFTSLERAGILEQTAGAQAAAVPLYKRALTVQANFGLHDSLAFKPNLYLGNAYYFLNNYDSALYYFKKAELLQQNDDPAEEQFRLYNSLGAIYFEGGNFQQSINYFYRALQLLASHERAYDYISYALHNNIASALRQMHLYDSSLHIYQSILQYSEKTEKDVLLLNISNIFLEKNLPDSALSYLSRISGDTAVEKTALYVRLGRAKYLQQQFQPSREYLDKAIVYNRDILKNEKNVEVADAYKILGDIAKAGGDYSTALEYYQSAIIQSDYNFNNESIQANPETFFSSFSSFSLFENLLAKANCLAEWQRQANAGDRIALAIKTYQSAFALLDYINKSYDNEQARLFIGQAAAPSYTDAVNWLLDVYEKDQKQAYLEILLQWTERSKAVALLIGSRENRLKWQTGIPDSLLQEERKLRNIISHLRLQAEEQTDSTTNAVVKSSLQENEVLLSRLISRFNDYPDYYRQKYAPDTINIRSIQAMLPGTHAVISFFNTGNILLCFQITDNAISLLTIPDVHKINSLVQEFTKQLQNQLPGKPNAAEKEGKQLFKELIAPLLPGLKRYEQLIIIPHKQLGYLPFEALQSGARFLLEDFVISYQQALTFLQSAKWELPDLENGLVMAPFPEAVPGAHFPVLPASKEEVKNLHGTVLYGKEASRQAFASKAGAASVIHLATHAVTNNDQPGRSFIAFYPHKEMDSTFKLYATDILSIPMHHTQLLFLSACETATGKLQEGEGILSLSRAFAEAGCSNVITSLWKAEDRATAYISQRFYYHLKREKNYAQALRKAKLDIMHDPEYAQFAMPSFWSHLVYIGNIQEIRSIGTPGNYLIAIMVGIFGTGLYFFYRVKRTH